MTWTHFPVSDLVHLRCRRRLAAPTVAAATNSRWFILICIFVMYRASEWEVERCNSTCHSVVYRGCRYRSLPADGDNKREDGYLDLFVSWPDYFRFFFPLIFSSPDHNATLYGTCLRCSPPESSVVRSCSDCVRFFETAHSHFRRGIHSLWSFIYSVDHPFSRFLDPPFDHSFSQIFESVIRFAWIRSSRQQLFTLLRLSVPAY